METFEAHTNTLIVILIVNLGNRASPPGDVHT
jgi:hypothetical protein